MRDYHLCGLGNAIVDIFVAVSDEEFASLGFERGTMRLSDLDEQQRLLARFHDREPRLVSGGSVANSVIALSQLGGKAAFIGCVGDDRYGLFYTNELEELDIDIGNPVIVGEATGTCLCLITPDAERTMRTCLGVGSHLAARNVDEERIKNSEWLFVEGYLFANPDTGQSAIREAIRLAKKHGTKVAVTCSEAFIVQSFGDPFREALRQTDLLFCNETEACAVAGNAKTADEAFARLKGIVPSAIVTAGSRGAYIRHDGVETHVPAFPCEPKDLTGAGDMFAGAFLHGITHGIAPEQAGRASCFLAMKVITQVGARLHHDTRQFWEQALAEAPVRAAPQGPNSAAEVRTRLHHIAAFVREHDQFGPEAKSALADLLDELSKALESSTLPPGDVSHLAETAAHLVEAAHEPEEQGVLAAGRDQLTRAVVVAETRAPTLTGLVERVVEALANVGI